MIGESKADVHERLVAHEEEKARYVSDLIQRSDDTRQLWRLFREMANVVEVRAMSEMSTGKHEDGRRYDTEDFWLRVGRIEGVQDLVMGITRGMEKAERVKEEEHAGTDSDT